MAKSLKATKLNDYIIEPIKTGYSNKWEGHHATNPCLIRFKSDPRVFLGYRAGGADDFYWVNGWDVWASHLGLAILDASNEKVAQRLPLPVMTIVRDVKLPQNAAEYKEYCKKHRDDVLILHDFRFFEYQGYLHIIYHESSVLDVWDCVVRMPVQSFLNKIDQSLKLMSQPTEKIVGQWHDLWWKEGTWQPCGINGTNHIFGSFVIKGDIVYFEKPDGSLQMCHRPLSDAIAVVDVGTKLYADRTADGFTEYGVFETCIRPGSKDNSHLGNNGMPTRAKIGETDVYINVTHGCWDRMIADENCNERHILYYPYFRIKDFHTGDVLYYSEEPILDYDAQWKEYTENGEWVSKNAALDGVMFTGGQIEAVPGKNGLDNLIAYVGVGDTAVAVAKFTLRQLVPDIVIADITARSKKHCRNTTCITTKNVYDLDIPVNGWNWKIENDPERCRINIVRSLVVEGKIETAIRPIHTAPGYFDADANIFDGSSVTHLPDIGWAVAYKGIRWNENAGKITTQVGFGVLVLHKNNPEKLLYRSTLPIGDTIVENGQTLGASVNIPKELAENPFQHVPPSVMKEIRRIGVLIDRKMLPLPQMVAWQQQKSQILGKHFRYGLFKLISQKAKVQMRFSENPLIKPSDIKPTRDDFEILCILNPAAIRYQDEILLLLRVAERPYQKKGFISVGTIDLERKDGSYRLQHFGTGDPLLKADDLRVISYDGITYLTSMSHLRLARSKDGCHFTVDPKPFIWPSGPEEELGAEDARITCIDNVYYIYYVAVSRYGFSTILVKTTDFKSYQHIGNIAHGVNKDVAIFPEKINGLYYALTRPDTGFFAKPSMWIASSPDLVYWGQHQHLFSPRKGMWDSSRVGAGTISIKTERGWLEIYHGADMKHRYSLGLALLDLENPAILLSRPTEAILEPEMNYEINGFFSNVVFTNGAIPAASNSDEIYLYYGATDQCVCGTTFSISDLLSKCKY